MLIYKGKLAHAGNSNSPASLVDMPWLQSGFAAMILLTMCILGTRKMHSRSVMRTLFSLCQARTIGQNQVQIQYFLLELMFSLADQRKRGIEVLKSHLLQLLQKQEEQVQLCTAPIANKLDTVGEPARMMQHIFLNQR